MGLIATDWAKVVTYPGSPVKRILTHLQRQLLVESVLFCLFIYFFFLLCQTVR